MSTVDERNRATSAQEVADFKATPPDRYFAYLGTGTIRLGSNITTWMGDKLGSIVKVGDVWRSNMGDRRVNFRARAINGATYSGTAYIDSGDYVRMRRVQS